MKTTISLFLLILYSLFFSIQFSLAQSPTWLNFSKRKLTYPDAEYYTGFGTASVNKVESIEAKIKMAESYAKQGLSESIKVTVQSNVVLQTIEENKKIAAEFTQSVVSFSNVNLSGLKTETWFDK